MTTETAARGIATTYRGTRFRSRLESRWAAFFDLIEWPWVYEPMDAAGWIPDFLIRGPGSFLVEVGPCETDADFRAKAIKPLAGQTDRVTLILGLAPHILDEPRAGYLTTDNWGSQPDFAYWAICRECGLLGIYHWIGSYQLRPCGDHDGDHHLEYPSISRIADLWAEAGNRVQWQPWKR